MKKIVIIGAGSSMFTQGLVLDLLSRDEIKWHIALVDIEPIVLDGVKNLVHKIMDYKKCEGYKLSAHTDRKEALTDADYVIITIGVGGRRAWEQDVFIPRKYGIYQPVGDTAMPGGISRAMRMVPAVLDIVKDVENICPQAKVFNYSNPMAVICRAIKKATKFPVVGLCIGVPGTEWYIADKMGFDRDKFTTKWAGFNHLTFIYDFRYEGKDARPILDEKLKTKEPTDTQELDEPFSWYFYKRYGAFPAPGDRHVTEFFTEYFPNGNYYSNKKLGVDAISFEDVIRYGDEIHDKIMAVGNSPEPLTDDYFEHIHGEHEQAVEMIYAIEKDIRKVYSANVPNNGAIKNLPYDAVLELPVVSSYSGFAPIVATDFPDFLASIINKHLAIIEVTADAALKGDRQLFEEAILMGGYINDRTQIQKMVDELLKTHKEYIPQFN